MLNIDLDAVQKIIREVANAEILPRFHHLKAEDISMKVGNEPVTIADQRAESALSERLSALLPGSKVLGEEAFAANHGLLDLFLGDDPLWIIDPIDGTKNFVDGKPIFAVIVSLTKQNQTIAAWIYDPLSGECLIAEKGAGAFHKGRKLQVLPSDFMDKMTGCGFEIEAAMRIAQKRDPRTVLSAPKIEPTLWSLAHEYARLLIGSPHLSAKGPQWHFHGLLTFSTPWDNAAGILIHAEAGGHCAHWNGDPYTPSAYKRGILLAPDKESWGALNRWVGSLTELPA